MKKKTLEIYSHKHGRSGLNSYQFCFILGVFTVGVIALVFIFFTSENGLDIMVSGLDNMIEPDLIKTEV